MAVSKHVLACACAVLLALGACTDTKHVGTGGPAALEELRASLAAAQAALAAGADDRAEARKVLETVRENLDDLREELDDRPAGAANTAIAQAAAAVGTAVEAVDAALADNAAMASGGAVSFADMHATLAEAREALNAAQGALATVLERGDLSDAQRVTLARARGFLTTAQVSLVPQLNLELAAAERDLATRTTERDAARAEIDRLTVRFGKDLAIDGREASRVAPAGTASVTLTPRRMGVGVAARANFDATSPSRNIRTQYFLTDYGTENAARLDIERDPVPYGAEAGMVVPGASGGDPATVEFPGRGQVFRGIGYDHAEFHLARQGSYGPASDGAAASAIPRFGGGNGLHDNLRGHAVSSFQYREEGGLTMKFGGLSPDRDSDGDIDANEGEGSLVFSDLEALTATGRYICGWERSRQPCDEAVTRDLTVSFGAPSRDPSGEPAYYWTVDVPDPRLTIAAGTAAALDQWTRADTVSAAGRYEMLLANHAGVDDKGTTAAGDDEERYLRYAAYGLFQAVDYQIRNPRPGRMQTFHYGFDAFGAHNELPAATADSIAATFNGRTMAWLVTSANGEATVTGLKRMRGNVTLHACLGGGGC